MREVDGSGVIILFGFMQSSAVYVGGMTNLENVTERLQWKTCDTNPEEPFEYLTLDDIADQAKGYLITVVVNDAYYGEIYQYGNYSDNKWWCIGTLDGYA